MTEKYVQANGLQLAYDEFGNPSHPAILLIMGLGTQMIAWPEQFCTLLASSGFRVIRFDNRDVGLSEKLHQSGKPFLPWMLLMSRLNFSVSAPYTLHDMVNDTVGLMDKLDLEAAHIVGASMGGMIAQLLTAKYPSRILSLTSMMSTSGDRSLPSTRPEVAAHMTRRPVGGEDEFLSYALRTWRLIGSPRYPQDDHLLLEKLRRSYRRSYYPVGFLRQLAAILASGNRNRELRNISCPTLLIHGKDDPLIPMEGSIHMAKLIPHANLQLIDGMGHDLPPQLIPKITQMILTQIN